MKAVLPFTVKYSPITKLALINFEKKPDKVYKGLELQYIDDEAMGKGYRIIAYRNDQYVDVFDEKSIIYKSDENFNVAGKGLNQHIQTRFENINCDKQNGKVHIGFHLQDCDKRNIDIDIEEHTCRKSTPMNLVAPIGLSSETPSALPVFFLYDFDFVRKRKSSVRVMIDGQRLKLDPFPFPVTMNLQWRYYTRYSMDSQIFEFLNTDNKHVERVDLDEDNTYTDGVLRYQFSEYLGNMALKKIEVLEVNHPLRVEFEPSIALVPHIGTFHIKPEPQMGSIDGTYQVLEEDNKIRIKVIPEQGWKPVPNSFITKLILGEKSIFQNWSKNYTYEQIIDKQSLSTKAIWINGNIQNK